MDSFQGSTPLNFIPFRLENLPKKNAPEPTTSQASVHANSEGLSSDPVRLQAENAGLSPATAEKDSPINSQGSSTDVTAYADAMVQKMKRHQESAPQQVSVSVSGSNAEVPPAVEATPTTSDDPPIRRSSTPIMSEEDEETCQADLSALESALQIIVTSESQLPELRDRTGLETANISGAPSRTDDENASSICDAPALPGMTPQVHFLGGQGDEEKTADEVSQVNPVALYGFNPFHPQSGTEGGDDTNSEMLIPGTSKDLAPRTQPTQSRLSGFSGRSRAILKEYFDEAAPIRLPVGHSTVPSLSLRYTTFSGF